MRTFRRQRNLPMRASWNERIRIILDATSSFLRPQRTSHHFAQAQEFFAGYLVEQSLSVDNLFVFILMFSYFKVPKELEPRVLNYGIYGAAVLRAIFIRASARLSPGASSPLPPAAPSQAPAAPPALSPVPVAVTSSPRFRILTSRVSISASL